MTFEDWMDEDTAVSKQEAESECRRHCCDVTEMITALGDKAEYQAREVLIWLGY